MNNRTDLLLEIYKDPRTVFTFQETGMLLGESDSTKLKQKLNYQVRNHNLLNLRKGIYAKTDFNPEELVCKIFKPSYLSLEYVLQKEGVIFQYSGYYSLVSYLSRSVLINDVDIRYRKIKEDILLQTKGINRLSTGINIATPERALLDLYYLDQDFYLDNPQIIDKKKIADLLPIYQSGILVKRARRNLEI